MKLLKVEAPTVHYQPNLASFQRFWCLIIPGYSREVSDHTSVTVQIGTPSRQSKIPICLLIVKVDLVLHTLNVNWLERESGTVNRVKRQWSQTPTSFRLIANLYISICVLESYHSVVCAKRALMEQRCQARVWKGFVSMI
jgi:hypothetical protein